MRTCVLTASISLLLLLLIKACTPAQQASTQSTDKSSGGSEVTQATVLTAASNYQNYCSGCHGEKMEAFADRRWVHDNSREGLFKAIKYGYIDEGMPTFDTTFTNGAIYDLADYILQGIEKVKTYEFPENKTASRFQSEEFNFYLDTIATDLEIPWGITFLPNGDYLVSDRNGKLYRVDQNQNKTLVSGTPKVLYKGQGGLMDLELHPDFANNGWVYLSYSIFKKEKGQTLSSTAIKRARLSGNELLDSKLIFEALPYSKRRHHYGSRMEFGTDGHLYFSVGDRGNRDRNPQSLDNHCGKVHRIAEDGSIPDDNPFVGQEGAMASIYSYGHRNPQGMARHPVDGKIWTHEHGPKGGDEVNIIRKANNYGWPVISYGINYNGTTFTSLTAKEGMEQPLHYWVPSLGVCGMTFVKGSRYKGWENDLMVGSLRFEYLNRCRIEDGKIVHEEKLLKGLGRLRCVEMGPDGYLYVGVEKPGRVFRLVPES
ncbi:MAG: PQQ-dependent sugar dehydrogenase [Bacteroidota bacterium]